MRHPCGNHADPWACLQSASAIFERVLLRVSGREVRGRAGRHFAHHARRQCPYFEASALRSRSRVQGRCCSHQSVTSASERLLSRGTRFLSAAYADKRDYRNPSLAREVRVPVLAGSLWVPLVSEGGQEAFSCPVCLFCGSRLNVRNKTWVWECFTPCNFGDCSTKLFQRGRRQYAVGTLEASCSAFWPSNGEVWQGHRVCVPWAVVKSAHLHSPMKSIPCACEVCLFPSQSLLM